MESQASRIADLLEADQVVGLSTAQSEVAAAHLDRRSSSNRHHRHLGLEMTVVCAVVVAVGSVLAVPGALLAAVLAMCLVVNYHAGRETVRPGLPHVGRILRDTALPVAVVAVGVAAGVVSAAQLSNSLIMVGAAAVVAMIATLARRIVNGQVRLLVVGDQMAIATAATRWAHEPRVTIVGALVLEPEATPPLADPELFGVRSINGIDEVDAWADRWDADMVVVFPGPGVNSEQVRQLSWHLEGAGASLAVAGVLDSIAPHRIDQTHFAGVTLMHVRSSRPSGFIRTTKQVVDRIAGALLLAAVAPVLALLALAIRIESSGPGIFRQIRVGKDGTLFTMYKLRSMHLDAEAVKADLEAENEASGLLFKMKHDPRITGLGAVLRKTSLDELPQLINVVKGEMSLIGPRPALPEEVERYSVKERRRLAVRPGITGLWQVSGRSDLDWETSVDLDLRYADNWRLTDDAVIGLRTFDAVIRSRGAY
ncbi:MAG: exopolysaccharide biosynthesis polyprenyl glycosylphosphotransferase [Nocardioides sp.]